MTCLLFLKGQYSAISAFEVKGPSRTISPDSLQCLLLPSLPLLGRNSIYTSGWLRRALALRQPRLEILSCFYWGMLINQQEGGLWERGSMNELPRAEAVQGAESSGPARPGPAQRWNQRCLCCRVNSGLIVLCVGIVGPFIVGSVSTYGLPTLVPLKGIQCLPQLVDPLLEDGTYYSVGLKHMSGN